MAVRPLVNLERLTTAHVNSTDGSMTYESGVAYKANTTVSYNGSLYTANVDIEDTDTDTPDAAPDKWSLTINASDVGTSGDISALAARVTALEDTVGDEDSGLVKDVDGITDNMFTNGCVNLCPITITSQTVDTGGTDVILTVNNDGTFTVNGTVTNSTVVNVTDVLANILEGGKQYNLSGSPIGSTSETSCLYISASGGGYDEGDGFSFNLEQLSSGARVRLSLSAGQTLLNVTFKPMITLASTPDSDYEHYVPYARSNRDLTTNLIKSKTFSVTTSTNGNADIGLNAGQILIGVSAHEAGDNVKNVVCIPYKYFSGDINFMQGVKVIKEILSNDELVPAINTDIEGTAWYIQL